MAATNPLNKEPREQCKLTSHCARCQRECYQETLDKSEGYCGICCFYKDKPYQFNPSEASAEVECIRCVTDQKLKEGIYGRCARCKLVYSQETLDKLEGYCGICCFYKDKPYQPTPVEPSTKIECSKCKVAMKVEN